MAERVTRAQRVQSANRAEVEIQRFARVDAGTGIRPHVLWHKHIHNVELDPVQVLKMQEMDQHANTIDVSCRRTGKTAVKEMHCLEQLATTPYQEEGIVAPRMQQSQTNLTYHIDAIRRSDILSSYIMVKGGREQLRDTGYQFVNHSKASAYGIMSQIDGDALTIASLEETDDMPQDRLMSRFMPMLGSARRMGVDPGTASFKPSVRITGVFKGADVLQALIDTKQYHLLTPVDVYLGIELGILNEKFMLEMRSQMPEGEFIRQFLCRNVAAQNWIWEKYIRKAMAAGTAAGLERADPLPGARYKKRGLLAFGYDHSGHGESANASRSALTVTEQIGNYLTFPFVKTWPAGTDDAVVMRDLFGFWCYFNPDYAMGDAYGLGMLTSLNDLLYSRGLTSIDRRTFGDGDSTATTWRSWAFAPIRFDGQVKHSMASVLRAAFHNSQAAIPYFDDGTEACRSSTAANVIWTPPSLSNYDPRDGDWSTFVRQLGNIKQGESRTSYATFRMADSKFGDDLFDAACAGVWALTTRGEDQGPLIIQSRVQSHQQLLGSMA
ncbi:hypothetical protein IGB42_02655 [Andreprevotia sp. IGB-42]|uniref:hypothetical protein n=1 Tax=Andreprevotia sp. IGB-42 TaxID=2497473 RepID=UPI00157E551C|nr:hypothetical protein [Andreprevotia sp. IGB-42]KAF0812812.1 hypothetical protein IGB42_02655 [Andreprevotia sp. IGB-42]